MTALPRAATAATLAERVAGLAWPEILGALDARGHATTGPLLTPEACQALTAAYDEEVPYRSRVVMARHNFGLGEYKYYRYPLPDPVQDLRQWVYPQLVPLARRWAEALGQAQSYPDDLDGYLDLCHAAGQERPTPLILRSGRGVYNCLHQDLYGDLHFPLQLAVLLSRPGEDFTGGEFVLTEQRPRMQSRATVVPLRQGEGVIFAVNERPQRGTRGFYRVKQRHGVSELRSGARHTLGIIFHDAT